MRIAFLLSLGAAAFAADWSSYRGNDGTGVARGSAPVSWNAALSAGQPRNIRWRTPIDGLGHSSPAIVGDRLFVVTAVSSDGKAPLKVGLYGSGDSADDNGEQQWVLYCLDRRDGSVLWRRTVAQGKPRTRRHTKATHANTTAAADSRHVVVFLGSEGLHSFTLDGKPEWSQDLGTLDMAPSDDRTLSWGFASSPVLKDGRVVVQADAKSGGFLAAFDAASGREIWRVSRGDVSVCSWATPAVIAAGGRTQVVANGYPFIAGYDFATGRELWRLRSGGDIPVPVPFLADGLIYVANAHGLKGPLYAIRPDASGEIAAGNGVVWEQERNSSYLQTPVAYRGIVYASTSQGIFKAYDAKTGERLYEKRLGQGGAFTSSPIAAGGRVYVTDEEGRTYVVKAGREFELVATNELDEIVLSTPAVVDGAMYIRTAAAVVAIR
ncbi:MAG: PQQ-binding-like beta-propeller repeat protein [Bryobacteraceae bacterium]